MSDSWGGGVYVGRFSELFRESFGFFRVVIGSGFWCLGCLRERVSVFGVFLGFDKN